ncbi:glutathione-dependent formaldehyde dehydrogenase [Streptomyces sp. PSKA54]|uniref:Glutathione-dependent formaldehyde dehydrogenase n=1 Tax=Streptomyces himalayensis subsp. aureolus TaxID=2758039 RepID=A0A7W2CYX9_9ACTN|nr:zinc-dependent alcohol dehydrogenase [Streptomyces himalayensis]MBA4861687.1 glutathione-dependent formaldehyde dehydrogenase [Streptomyces himalayensis subsp. aureolus]
MKALCWTGVGELAVETVPDPALLNDQDAIVRVTASSVCGSDLHLINGYVPAMRAGDIIGHEFVGEIVEVGTAVRRHKPGDRVVVCSVLGCGRCWQCRGGNWSLCENSNPNPAYTETLYGQPTAGIIGYSHAMGGFAGSHAEYIRVPFADYGAFPVPNRLSDEEAVFASDAVPTGWMGADQGGVKEGDVVAVWGAGGVGQMAARASYLLGAERVAVIDRVPERLKLAASHCGAATIDYSETDVDAALREFTGGRGPDVCIEAVGMEAHGTGPQYAYDRAKQALRMHTDRSVALREAIHACRKGGTVSILGVFGGVLDKFPLGAAMNKGLTLRMGQQHGQRYIPMLLERMAANEIETGYLATHPMPLTEGPRGYQMFEEKTDGCLRAVFLPQR